MRNLLLPCLIMLQLLFSNCHKSQKVEKDVNNYYPKVKTLSAEKLPDGTVKVTALIVSTGNQALDYVGFCMDTLPSPGMLSNQVIVSSVAGDTFSYVYNLLDYPRKYYFRAWVTNGNGYAMGQDVYADSIAFDSSLIPCNMQIQHLFLTDSAGVVLDDPYNRIENLSGSGSSYSLDAYANSHRIEINFGKLPLSGIYSIVPASEPEDTYVTMMVDGIYFNSTGKLYVRMINRTVAEFTICSFAVSLPVGYFGYTYKNYTLSTKFRAAVRL